jgi:peroxiredoxin
MLFGLLGLVAGASTLAVFNGATPQAQAAAPAGKKAPAFTLKDSHGRSRSLSEFKGRYVVLEWLNYGCPFVKKHYNSGNMQKTQREARKAGAVWLSINSSAAGKQGHMSASEANKMTREKKAFPSAVLLDSNSKVARLYGAQTTPHMFVINPKGYVIYNGAIDDKPSTDIADIKGAKNYVLTAIAQAKKGQKVSTPATQPYGCSVKY